MIKKFLCVTIITFICAFTTISFAASVTPILYSGNDANPNQFTPPAGSVRITLPNSSQEGTHVYTFNEFGELDSAGSDTLTIVVGKATGTDYTQVLSWTWNGTSTLDAIILKGGPAFNLYQYNGETSDTNLVCPTNPSGHPADISHVSVILFPQVSPPVPPDCSNKPIVIELIIIMTLIVILLITNFFLLLCCFCKGNQTHC